MNQSLARCFCGLVWFASGLILADEPVADPRLDHMQEQAKRMQITGTDPNQESVPVTLHPEPLLRYTNPLYEGQSDGALLMWCQDSTPVVLGSYSIRHNQMLHRELVSFSETPMTCRVEEQVVWAPSRNGFARQNFPDAASPAVNPRMRLLQMKRMADRISVTDLRRLTTPLYRYSSEQQGVIDGAVFAMVKANDPELLILIEAYQSGDDPAQWRFSLARMSSQPMEVKLDGTQVWSPTFYWRNPRAPTDPYVEQRDSPLPPELSEEALKTNGS
ncbi:hypothetical protein NHH03_11130 [Stieleria sp. TO1_6]|uniref:hypothetical protein n=1 Tax=Stieleria tagensis TaxID=2956795 RepID=UPI00209B8AA1|nr:hypothetical protein [Stieleria tagensis]MCO8122293.1 hypothetical protein [Stieleria tagensis]